MYIKLLKNVYKINIGDNNSFSFKLINKRVIKTKRMESQPRGWVDVKPGMRSLGGQRYMRVIKYIDINIYKKSVEKTQKRSAPIPWHDFFKGIDHCGPFNIFQLLFIIVQFFN